MKKSKKETGSGPSTKLPGPFGRLLRPAWVMRAKPSTSTQAIDARMGEEEKYKNQKEEKMKETGEWAPNPAISTIRSPLTTRMDHTVCIF